MNLVRTDSTPSLTLLSERKNKIRDAVERVLTSSRSVRLVLKPRKLSMLYSERAFRSRSDRADRD